MTWLTAQDTAVLGLVLEPRLDFTRKGNPGIQPLSLYSSELKGLKQLAGALEKVKNGAFASQEQRTRDRYFRSLSIHGLVTGNATAPVLTSESAIVFAVAANDDGSLDFWQRNRDAIEGPLVLAMAQKLSAGLGHEVHDHAKRVFWNSQLLFDLVPDSDITSTLADLDLLKVLQFSNSVGIEAARYFRLNDAEKTAFRAAFQKVLSTGKSAPSAPADEIEGRALQYYKASTGNQADIRFRVAGFLTAYRNAQIKMGTNFPRLNRDLKVANMTESNAETTSVAEEGSDQSIGPHQLIVSGCPGSGKSYWLEDLLSKNLANDVRTQFHAETTYYDFVGTYKPVPVFETVANGTKIKTADGKELAHGRPLISYQYVPGPFVSALVQALNDPTKNVVLVIEELNRGNCAAIFGDIFQLLDRGKDGRSRYGITASLDMHDFLFQGGVLAEGEKLRLPANLYLWATMNSADQGVFPLDSAFRRRWDFAYRGHGEPCAYPADARQIKYNGSNYDWDKFRSALNTKLGGLGIHEDKLIGPYFLTEKQLSSPDAVLNKLFLYLWDDVLRFRQDELFTVSSFSEVEKVWNNAEGTPLKFEVDLGLEPSTDEQSSPEAEESANSTDLESEEEQQLNDNTRLASE
nr:AAA family ATPase [Amylibacter sp.]